MSCRWFGKRPGEKPIGIGDWRANDGDDSVRPGEYGRRFRMRGAGCVGCVGCVEGFVWG